MKKWFLRSFVLLLSALSAIYVLLLIQDVVDLWFSPEEYRQIYGFDGLSGSWQHRTMINYTLTNTILIAFFGCAAGIGWILRNGLDEAGAKGKTLLSVVAGLFSSGILLFFLYLQ